MDKVFVRDILGNVPYADAIKEHADCECLFKQTFSDTEEVVTGERAAVHWASTKHVDEQGDVVVPGGVDLEVFRKTGTVFIDHGSFWDGYTMDKVVGSAMWIKNKNDQGLLAKTRFAKTGIGDDALSLVADGHVKGWSIGFIGLEASLPGDKSWGEAVAAARAGGDMKGYTPKWLEAASRIWTKAKLLEYSLVAIPANSEALTIAVAKGLNISETTLSLMGVDKIEIGNALLEESEKEAQEKTIKMVKRIIPKKVVRLKQIEDVDIVRTVQRALDTYKGRL